MKITELDIERFTCGDCAILAKEIERASNGIWKLSLLDSELHAFVSKDDMVMDIFGVQPVEDIIRSWEANFIFPASWEYVHDNWYQGITDYIYGEYSYRRARILAPLLLKEAEGEFSFER